MVSVHVQERLPLLCCHVRIWRGSQYDSLREFSFNILHHLHHVFLHCVAKLFQNISHFLFVFLPSQKEKLILDIEWLS